MKKTVKLLAVLMSLLLLVCAFTGCGKNVTDGSSDDGSKQQAEEKEGNGVGTVYEKEEYGFQMEAPQAGDEIAIMHTSMGDVYIRFFPEAAPKAVQNFTTHAKNGYYDGLTFHRVINEFMIQGGDPDGTGGKSIWGEAFEDEFDQKLLNLRGSLAMANSGVNTNGSQFFINQGGPTGDTAAQLKTAVESSNEQVKAQISEAYTQYASYYGDSFTSLYPTEKDFLYANLTPAADLVQDAVWDLYAEYGGNIHLDGAHRYTGGHTVFGQVFKGMDVVDAIAAVETDESTNKPLNDVTIKFIEITTWKE